MEKEKDLRLTPRELEILQLTAKGLEQTQIAEILGISFATVAVSYTHLRAHDTEAYLVCRRLG